jgi:hypothetical protein
MAFMAYKIIHCTTETRKEDPSMFRLGFSARIRAAETREETLKRVFTFPLPPPSPFQGTSEVAKPNFNESHPKLLHPSADDSQIFDQLLNGMSQNGKCLVNVPCDSWYVVLPGAVESVKGS